jgi:F-type H+-transporting ATPase subunit delta
MAGDITTIARPYAQAAFSRATETGQLDPWSQALADLAAIAESDEMARQIANPNVPRERLRDIILSVAGDGLPEEARNLVRLLADNSRLGALPEIARLFDELKTAEQGVRQVLVRSAFAMNAAQQRELAAALKARLGADVELTVEKDTALIGGIEVRAGDLVIDGTVRGKIQRLATELQI